MRIQNLTKLGTISYIAISAMFSCQKNEYKLAKDVPVEISDKVDLFIKESEKITKNPRYELFGYDTLELKNHFISNPMGFANYLDKEAQVHTPKTKIGQHLENLMIPKSGGGFDIIPYMEDDYKPDFREPKGVITSSNIYKNGKKFCIPVEYWGIRDN